MYELLVIGNPKVDSEQVLALVDRALKEISASGVKVDKMGRKNLSFTIAKQTEGEYLVFNFDADGDKVREIDRKLRLSQETILRYLLVKSQGIKGTKGTKGTEGADTQQKTEGAGRVIEKASEKEDNETKVKVEKAKSKTKKVAVKVKGKK